MGLLELTPLYTQYLFIVNTSLDIFQLFLGPLPIIYSDDLITNSRFFIFHSWLLQKETDKSSE